MTVSLVSLQPGISVSSSGQTVATATVTPTVVTGAVINNNGSSAVSAWVSVLRSGASASVPLVSSRTVSAASSQTVPELSGLVLSSGDKIQATGTGLNFVINGFTVS